GDEDGAKDRAQHRTQAADNDHRQIVDGNDDLKRLIIGDAEIVGVENAAHARIERGDRKGDQLVAEDIDADDLGGDILVANGDEGATDPAAHDVDGGDDREHREEQQKKVELALSSHIVPKQTRA